VLPRNHDRVLRNIFQFISRHLIERYLVVKLTKASLNKLQKRTPIIPDWQLSPLSSVQAGKFRSCSKSLVTTVSFFTSSTI
jgi:hypothetical protein